MISNLEGFSPKLRSGRVIPQGSRIIFETDNPYNQIVLPMALADMILLCSGQFTVREIVEKIYKKQGSVPFKSILTALHLLHQGGFFENGDQLTLSSHLQSWMEPRQTQWTLSWRFSQRLATPRRYPFAFYMLTLVGLLLSIFGFENVPAEPLLAVKTWASAEEAAWVLFQILVCSSVIQTVRYLICGAQLLLLTAKAYNVALRMSPWGIHFYVGDEANDLFENRLYTSMFHISQILVSWLVVYFAGLFLAANWLVPLVLMASAMTFWQLNPFINSDGRKLLRALLISNDRDVMSWHFESNTLINSLNPEAQRRDQDFVRLCAGWGVLWLMLDFAILHKTASVFGPSVLTSLIGPGFSSLPVIGLAAWLGALYYVVHALVEVIGQTVVRPYWGRLVLRLRRFRASPHKAWELPEILEKVEDLPLFSHFHENFLDKIVRQSLLVNFNSGATVILKGDPARELFVLLSGEVEVLRGRSLHQEDWSIQLSPVSVFGESSLVDESSRAASVIARSSVTVLRVPVHVLREVAHEAQSVRQLEVFRNAILVNQFFSSSPVFRSLSPTSIDFLCSRGTLEYFDRAQAVFQQGDRGDSLFLILRGSVDVEVHSKVVKRLHQGSFFGEIALIANIPRTATIRTTEPCVFFKISSDAFWDVLVQHMDLGVFIETVSESRLKEDLDLLPNLGNAS